MNGFYGRCLLDAGTYLEMGGGVSALTKLKSWINSDNELVLCNCNLASQVPHGRDLQFLSGSCSSIARAGGGKSNDPSTIIPSNREAEKSNLSMS